MIRKLNLLEKAGVGVASLGTIAAPSREHIIVPVMFIKLPEPEGSWAWAWDDAKTTTKRETKMINFIIAIDVKELVCSVLTIKGMIQIYACKLPIYKGSWGTMPPTWGMKENQNLHITAYPRN